MSCRDYDSTGLKIVAKFDSKNLFPEEPCFRINPSIVAWKDGYLMAWRDGWKGSNIWVGTLTRDFAPVACKKLDLTVKRSDYGREDPRLWWFRGKLHISFTGVQSRRGGMKTHVLYARLDDDLSVSMVFVPEYSRRNDWEKNWAFFEHDNKLYAVYSPGHTHRVISIDGNKVDDVSEFQSFPWHDGEPRGGCPPIRVGDEFWHFFHSRLSHGLITYRMGLYTFEAKPPFSVIRYAPKPIHIADVTTKPADQYAAVLFPGGAINQGGKWLVAQGAHDRWIEIHSYDAIGLEKKLIPWTSRL